MGFLVREICKTIGRLHAKKLNKAAYRKRCERKIHHMMTEQLA